MRVAALIVVSVAALLLGVGRLTSAAPGINAPTTTASGAGDGTIVAGAGDGSTSVVPGSTVPPVVCVWLDDITVAQNGRYERGSDVYLDIDTMLFRFRPGTGEAWVYAVKECTRAGTLVSRGAEWRPVSPPDPEVIARSMYDEVVKEIPLPSPDMSPTGRGFVNLGMWLAVSPQDPIVADADVGTVWATTAELVSTTFDMGNGDVVSCDGVGDPIPESRLDSVEESPVCGHTYRDVAPGGAYTVSITSSWQVSWTSSAGAGGTSGPWIGPRSSSTTSARSRPSDRPDRRPRARSGAAACSLVCATMTADHDRGWMRPVDPTSGGGSPSVREV